MNPIVESLHDGMLWGLFVFGAFWGLTLGVGVMLFTIGVLTGITKLALAALAEILNWFR